MPTFAAAEHVSFQQTAPNHFEMIVSPDRQSLGRDIENSAKADRMINEMRGLGFFVHQHRRDDGGRVIKFSK